MRHSALHTLPADLRESRMLLRINELRFERDQMMTQVRGLKAQVERKNLRLKAMRRELDELLVQIGKLERAYERLSVAA